MRCDGADGVDLIDVAIECRGYAVRQLMASRRSGRWLAPGALAVPRLWHCAVIHNATCARDRLLWRGERRRTVVYSMQISKEAGVDTQPECAYRADHFAGLVNHSDRLAERRHGKWEPTIGRRGSLIR